MARTAHPHELFGDPLLHCVTHGIIGANCHATPHTANIKALGVYSAISEQVNRSSITRCNEHSACALDHDGCKEAESKGACAHTPTDTIQASFVPHGCLGDVWACVLLACGRLCALHRRSGPGLAVASRLNNVHCKVTVHDCCTVLASMHGRGMVEVCEGAPVAVSGWVLTDRHDVRPCAASSLHRETTSVSNVIGGTGTLGIA